MSDYLVVLDGFELVTARDRRWRKHLVRGGYAGSGPIHVEFAPHPTKLGLVNDAAFSIPTMPFPVEWTRFRILDENLDTVAAGHVHDGRGFVVAAGLKSDVLRGELAITMEPPT